MDTDQVKVTDPARIVRHETDFHHLKEGLLRAEDLKQEGNVHFKEKEWHKALVSYRTGLAHLPPRTTRGKERDETGELDQASDDQGEADDDRNRHGPARAAS